MCAFAGIRHYSACPKPFPVFLSWGSAMTALVCVCQKPWLLPWQCHTTIVCVCAGRLRLLQRRHKNRSENGECCRRNLLNANQLLHSLSFIRPEKHSGSKLSVRAHSLSLSILQHIPISTRRNILFVNLFKVQSKLIQYCILFVGIVDKSMSMNVFFSSFKQNVQFYRYFNVS